MTLTQDQIQRTLRKLVDGGILTKRAGADDRWNRTNWYAFVDEDLQLSGLLTPVSADSAKSRNARRNSAGSIPRERGVDDADSRNHSTDVNADVIPDGKPSARASRLPQDWTLPKAWGEWALSRTAELAREFGHWQGGAWTDAYVRLEAEKFRNYWIGKSGKDAAKLDWKATWENWVVKAGPMPVQGRKGGGSWWLSDELALAKANEVGVGPAHPHEQRDAWHARIRAAIDNGGKPPSPRPHIDPAPVAVPSSAADEPRAAIPEDARRALLDVAKRCSLPKHLAGGARSS
ncbi:hypothetical protein [Burkholderia anthina]|uniref:hypothetical protein n=1 Tax=Burkholderia anthina TaxID=179879 RepID=UPI0015885C57|nr:hypothetical protein [Burkholderia anthina]